MNKIKFNEMIILDKYCRLNRKAFWKKLKQNNEKT